MRLTRCGVLLLMSLVALPSAGCSPGVPAADYDAAVAALDVAEERADAAEAEAGDLRSSVDALTDERDAALSEAAALEERLSEMSCGESAQEAWDALWERHERVRIDVPERGTLLELAPWMIFPEPPPWLADTTVCSVHLSEDPDGQDSVCIVESPGDDMVITVQESEGLIAMDCRGGSLDYAMTVTTGKNGRIIQQMFTAGEDYAQLEWVGPEGMERFVALYNGIEYTSYWPAKEGEYEPVYKSFVDWLYQVGADGGLIRPEDRPMMMIGLGELRGLPYAGLTLSDAEALKRAAADLMFGVPQGCLL
jgi:hypothetical protein